MADVRANASRQADILAGLIEYLPTTERRLAEAILADGQSIANLAKLLGRPRLKVHRQFARLVRRVTSERFKSAARHLRSLTVDERRLTQHLISAAKTLRATAAEIGLSLHQVRKASAGLSAKLARLDADLRARQPPALGV